jgi:tmRNA-binding protein
MSNRCCVLFSSHSMCVNNKFFFRHTRGKKFYRKRDKEKERERERERKRRRKKESIKKAKSNTQNMLRSDDDE